jgi:YD repeat-containing protein
MKELDFRGSQAGVLTRLIPAFCLLLVAFGANASSGDDMCFALYAKSGAVQGSKFCRLDVASNTPGGMGNYACINDTSLIDRWCATPATEEPEQSCPVADPVYPASGAVTLNETDFVSGDDLPVTFSRTYRSKPLAKNVSAMGPAWFHGWQRQLGLANANSGSSSKVLAYRANGEPVTFNWSSGVWRAAGLVGLTLTQNASNWTLTDLTTGIAETYSAQGVLLSESTRTGITRTLTYDGAGLLTAITRHAAGASANNDLTLRLDYDSKGRLSRLNDPMGGITQYAYDSNGNLVSVIWPDGNMRRYVYDDTRFRNAITGEIDEAGTRIATWAYDAQGRASAVSHPDASRNVQFAYSTGKTTVTDSQRVTTLNFSSIGGMLRPTGSSSSSATTQSSWSASGNLLTETTASGGTTDYSYDDTGRPIRRVMRTESGTHVVSTRYVDATGIRPSMIASPGSLRAFVYDAKGNLTGFSDRKTSDPTGELGFDASWDGQQQRTTGIRYDASNRVDGAKVFVNGELVQDWWYVYDDTGNLRLTWNAKSPWAWGVTKRDAAHRPTYLPGDNREAYVTYDARGRVSRFLYNESPTAANGGLSRILTVNYGYSADGRVVSRTGTVATNNGGSTRIGAPVAISSDELDQWLDNYESGMNPIGPPANRLGWVRSLLLGASPEPGLERICLECMFNPALSWGWAASSDNADPFGIIGLAGTLRGAVDGFANLCKPTQVTTEQLIANAISPHNGTGLSNLARAWDKHSGRHPDYYPPLQGNIAEKNAATEKWLRNLMNNPTTVREYLGRGGVDFRAPDGTGARYNAGGQFSGVLNPRESR